MEEIDSNGIAQMEWLTQCEYRTGRASLTCIDIALEAFTSD